MTTQIRQSVFETNSSSSHSITISNISDDGLMDLSLIPDENGNIVLNGGEFGWQWERFNDALTKANYCAVDGRNNELLREVICEQTGAKDVIFNFTTTDYTSNNHSYIDHDSEGVSYEAVSSKENLRQFIFNKTSWLFLGNNNESSPVGFYDTSGELYRVKITFPDEVKEFEIDDPYYSFLDNGLISWEDRPENVSINLEEGTVSFKQPSRNFKFDFDGRTVKIHLSEFPVYVNSCKDLYRAIDSCFPEWHEEWERQERPDFVKEFTINLVRKNYRDNTKEFKTVRAIAELVLV